MRQETEDSPPPVVQFSWCSLVPSLQLGPLGILGPKGIGVKILENAA